jgi:hypothetical protein
VGHEAPTLNDNVCYALVEVNGHRGGGPLTRGGTTVVRLCMGMRVVQVALMAAGRVTFPPLAQSLPFPGSTSAMPRVFAPRSERVTPLAQRTALMAGCAVPDRPKGRLDAYL